MRAVLDVNVLISGVLSRHGAPARLLRLWLEGGFELVVSPKLLEELERALAYPKVRQRIPADAAGAFIGLLRASARLQEDPEAPRQRSADPADDYLLALAEADAAILVSGDQHLLDLSDRFPVLSPAAFETRLQ